MVGFAGEGGGGGGGRETVMSPSRDTRPYSVEDCDQEQVEIESWVCGFVGEGRALASHHTHEHHAMHSVLRFHG